MDSEPEEFVLLRCRSGREPGCVAGARRRCWDCAREKQPTSGPAGRLAAIYASLWLKVLVGIPENSAPGTTHMLPEQEK